MLSLLVVFPMLLGSPIGLSTSRVRASVDTTVAPDTGLVLLTDTAVHTLMRLDTALNAVTLVHTELQSVYHGFNEVNPYAIAKAPLLVAVLERAGWTPMYFSRVRDAYMKAMEGIMPVAITGTRPGTTTIADRNVNYLIDHQVEYGIHMDGANLPPPSTPSTAPSEPQSTRQPTQDTANGSTKGTATDAAAFQEVTLTPDQGTLAELLANVARRAQRDHLTPVVDVGAVWCAPCHQLDSLMHHASMRDAMRGILLVHLNLDYWHDELDSLGINAASVPVMFAVDQRGTPLDARMQGFAVDALPSFLETARTHFSPPKTSRH